MNLTRQNHAHFLEANGSAVVADTGISQPHELRFEPTLDSVSHDAHEGSTVSVEAAMEAARSAIDRTEPVSSRLTVEPSGTLQGSALKSNASVISAENFNYYVCPVASTDYANIESLDPRLADRVWRLNNLYWVVNEDGDLIQFKLRPAQQKLLNGLHYRNIILKARQLGFTTFICIFLLDYALFNSNKSVGIVAHTKDDATVIFRKVKVAWENFPQAIKDFFKLYAVGDSSVEYEFTNKSSLRVSTSLRSGTYQAVLVTEFGKICAHFPEKAQEIITGTLPAVPAKGLIFIESTAEGEDGPFFDMTEQAMEMARFRRALTSKDFKFFFFPWYENPSNVLPGDVEISREIGEYLEKTSRIVKTTFTKEQKNWYFVEQKTQKDKMKREHPSSPDEAFMVSGNKLFSGEIIDAQTEKYAIEPLEIDGDFLIYRRFNTAHLYGLGADVSQGVKRDSSTIVVIDFTSGEIVFTYRSNEIDPVLFAHEIKKVALMYGGCIAAPEANNVGMTTCATLNAIYSNIYTQQREGLLEITTTNKLGYLTTSATKPKYMYEFSEALANDEVHCLDKGILLEAKRFNKDDALAILPSENTTRHFDLLIAASIAWQMRATMSRGKADADDVAKTEERRGRILTQGRKAYR